MELHRSVSYSLLTYSLLGISKNVQATHNHFHNILGLFDVLPNFPFTTSETMDYYL